MSEGLRKGRLVASLFWLDEWKNGASAKPISFRQLSKKRSIRKISLQVQDIKNMRN